MTPSDEARRLLRKADQDRAVFHAIKNQPGIDAEAACFHAQQAVEKSLKAVLLAKGVSFRRTHDLDELVDRILDEGLAFPFPSDHFSPLTPCAVHLRYDDLEIEGLPLADAERMMEEVRRWAGEVVEGGSGMGL
ncbi:MAG: HEPN domain-containing protein [Magnetococcales bacterium]|nr:HEPN domain-containing protein [Magnetococcales bacterium]